MKPSTQRVRRGISDLAIALYRERSELSGLRMLDLGVGVEPQEMTPPSGDTAGWRMMAPGERWGGQDRNAWFHGEARVPEAWRERLGAGRYTVALRLLLGESPDFGWPEGLLYLNGALLQGVNQHHPDILLPANVAQAESLAFDVRAWSGIMPRDHRLEYAEIALLDREMEALYYLLRSGLDLVETMDERDPIQQPLFAALQAAYDQLDLRQPESAALDRSASAALNSLRERLAGLRAMFDPPQRPRVTAIGHGHLDVAWLWQTHHTREKTARTFAVATALMDLYPEYHFLHTTPQVYDWLSRDYPDLFDRVRTRIAEGRFEAAGAMWLEPDTNLVSGESLVRQILYGQRYLRETFGTEYDLLWLPDTFGYTYALPQILLKSGIRVFMTTKMSWSDTNRIPHDTFRWRGLDGSETLAHFVTTPWLSYNPHDTWVSDTDTYNGRLDALAVRKLWERYRSKDVNQDLLLIYGYGDGGAGPTRQMIESYRALTALPGMPDIRLERADGYFHALRERVWTNPELPVWDGELYLEYHRGVYTTHGWLKRLHRRNEERLLLAESLDAQRWALAHAAEHAAPEERAALDAAWRTLLLHQFHDILPGSSIAPVYDDARRDLTALAEQLDSFIEGAARDIAALAGTPASGWLLYNLSPLPLPAGAAFATLPLASDGPVPALVDSAGAIAQTQEITSLAGRHALLIETPEIAGRGWSLLHAASEGVAAVEQAGAPTVAKTDSGGAILENALIRVVLDAGGAVTSLIDKREAGGRELIPADSRANVFVAYDDRPKSFDAWDIDADYDRKPYTLDSARLVSVDAGPLRASVRINGALLGSSVSQDISIYRDSPRVEFATHIEWHERHLLLKATFPFDLRVTAARSEIQYGSISRPTHRNTSWDEARFETVAHRWVDLSEAGYGIALLNDGKYGHAIHDATIGLSLLRSPTLPAPDADQGPHDVTYSLLPHHGAWPAGDVIAHGYALNRPPLVIAPESYSAAVLAGAEAAPRAPLPLFSTSTEGVVIEAVKRAAEGDGLIVRVYEAEGARRTARITSSLPLSAVVETDLLERPLREGASPAWDLWRDSSSASHDEPALQNEVEGVARAWTFTVRPFEIRTFLVTLTPP